MKTLVCVAILPVLAMLTIYSIIFIKNKLVCCKLNKCSTVAEMGDRLVTIDMGRKVGGAAVPLSVGDLGLHLTQCPLG